MDCKSYHGNLPHLSGLGTGNELGMPFTMAVFQSYNSYFVNAQFCRQVLVDVTQRTVFGKTLFHMRAMLLIFYAEYTESVVNLLLYPQPTMGSSCLGPERNFQD